MSDVTIDGLDRVLAKLGKLERLQDALGPPMEASASYVRRRMEREPRKAKGAFSALATPAQKRAYWWRVSQEEGMHGADGYQRGSGGSGKVSMRWTTEIQRTGNGLIGTIGNNADYAIYIYTRAQQQPFHRASGWPVVETVVEESEPYITRQFRTTIKRILNS